MSWYTHEWYQHENPIKYDCFCFSCFLLTFRRMFHHRDITDLYTLKLIKKMSFLSQLGIKYKMEKVFSHYSLGLDFSLGCKQGTKSISLVLKLATRWQNSPFQTTRKKTGSEPSALFTINSQLLVVRSFPVFLFYRQHDQLMCKMNELCSGHWHLVVYKQRCTKQLPSCI